MMRVASPGALGLLALFSLGCSRGAASGAPDLGTATSADTILNGSSTPGTDDVDSGDDLDVEFFSDVPGTVTGLPRST